MKWTILKIIFPKTLKQNYMLYILDGKQEEY